jgi:hypothetical protein
MLSFISAFRARSELARFDPRPLQRKAAAAAIGALAFATIAARAQAEPVVLVNSASSQSRHICQAVIGVQPSDYHFAGCVASLNAALQDTVHDEAVARAQSDCFKQGLKPRSADLSLCLLRADDAAPGAGTDGSSNELEMAASGVAYPGVVGSYTSASFDAVLHREREACARLGIDPNSGAFVGCVSSLQGQLQSIDFPSN